jgi:flagellar hook protein FlgE
VGDTFDTPMQIFDSLGESHVVTITFTKTAGGWDWDMTVPGDEVAPASLVPGEHRGGA